MQQLECKATTTHTIKPVNPTTSFKTLSKDFASTEGDPGELQDEGVLGDVPALHLGDAPSIALRSGVRCMMLMIYRIYPAGFYC